MAFLNWTCEYNVGIDHIDRQHLQLVELINNLHSAMKNGAPRSEIQAVFIGLASYTKHHFAEEEAFMKSIGFEDLAHHQKLHSNLIAHLDSLWRDFEAGKLTVSLELMKFLKTWLMSHVLNNDKKYAAVAVCR
jgi:hemerythrin-like metal-binding protein